MNKGLKSKYYKSKNIGYGNMNLNTALFLQSLPKYHTKSNPYVSKTNLQNHSMLKPKQAKFMDVELLKEIMVSKTEIPNLKIIGQFDKKFLIAMRKVDKSILIFDQHACHERILYEYYTSLLKNEILNLPLDQIEENKTLSNPFQIIFGKFVLNSPLLVHKEELEIDQQKFQSSYKVSSMVSILNFSFSIDSNFDFTFYSFPVLFDKLHKAEVLLKVFSELINNLSYYAELFTNKDPKLLNLFDLMIKSKACRNAIKFNDEIDNEYIRDLYKALGRCKNPFLCAHGRHDFYLIKKAKV